MRLFYFLPFILLISCSTSSSDSLPPLTCDDFYTLEVQLNELNENEYAVSFENPYSLENLVNQGIRIYPNFGAPYLASSESIDLKFLSSSFDTVVSKNLIKGLEYEVYAYARISEAERLVNCETMIFSFISNGTSDLSEWSVYSHERQGGFGLPIGLSMNNKFYYFYPSQTLLTFDPIQEQFDYSEDFPLRGHGSSYFNAFTIDDIGYFTTYMDRFLGARTYKYNTLDDVWDAEGIPISFPGRFNAKYTFAEDLDNHGYIFNKNETAVFNPDSNFSKLLFTSSGSLTANFIDSFKNSTGIFSVDSLHNILRLNLMSNSWEKIAEYPGQIGDKNAITSFTNEDIVYLGYSLPYNDLWSFNTNTLEWTELASFPLDLENKVFDNKIIGLVQNNNAFLYMDSNAAFNGVNSQLRTYVFKLSLD